MAEQKVGLSLSMCVGDVIAGLIDEAEIHGIVAATAAGTPEDVDKLMADYRELYWQEDPDVAEELARTMLADGRVYQPRLEGKPMPRSVPLRWLNVVDDWRESYPVAPI